MTTKRTVVAILAIVAAVGILAGAVAAQGPPGDAGPPDDAGPGGDQGPPENMSQGPPENVTRGPPENVTRGSPEGVAEFVNTSVLGPGQVDPNSLSGKIRVESQHVGNTTVELVEDSENESVLDVTVTGNATNVTFFVQKQPVEASQDIENLTVEVDGEPTEFGVAEKGGGNWITFEIEHFSTRTVTFTSTGANTGGDGSPDDGIGDGGVSEDVRDAVTGGDDLSLGDIGDAIKEYRKDGEVDGVEISLGEIGSLIREYAG